MWETFTKNPERCKPVWMIASLVLADCFSLSVAAVLSILVRQPAPGVESGISFASMIAFALMLLTAFASLGFYSGVSLSAPEELRRSVWACMFGFFFVTTTSLFMPAKYVHLTKGFAFTIAFAAVLVPVSRELVRSALCRRGWWGYPAIVFGDPKTVQRYIHTLLKQPSIGLRPIALVVPDESDADTIGSLPKVRESDAVQFIEQGSAFMRRRGYAILLGNSACKPENVELLTLHRELLPNIVLFPDLPELRGLAVKPKNVGGLLGLEVRDHLLHPGKRLVKRMLDIALTVAVLILLAPISIAIALAVKFTSAGPIFYGQRRIGRGGKEFRAWKFRSMIQDADAKLVEYLAANPAMAEEWRRNHKLMLDPRVTPIGRFLRATSLDEFPQLWNVLRGEMSLVGPRPIVRDEIPRYGRYYPLYTSVAGGVTGLWQVSGRSQTTYDERVHFDVFYVRNWSVWLDMYILFRTVGVLCLRTGAY